MNFFKNYIIYFNSYFDNLVLVFRQFLHDKKQQFLIFIERKFNISHNQILEAIFISSFSLVIFRFIYRILFWGNNTYWYYNLLIFFFSGLLTFKFPIYNYLREGLVTYIYSPLLGKEYYKHLIEKEYISDKYQEIMQRIRENYIFKKQKDYNVNHNVFIFIFESLIFLRLIILKYKYLFIILNIILIYFLLFNNHFIIASLISITLMISRISFFLTDNNIEEFYYCAKHADLIKDRNYDIIINRKNIKLISLWIVRSLEERENYYAEKKHHENIIKRAKESYYSYLSMFTYDVNKEYYLPKIDTLNYNNVQKYLLNYHYEYVPERVLMIIEMKEKPKTSRKLIKYIMISIIVLLIYFYFINNTF